MDPTNNPVSPSNPVPTPSATPTSPNEPVNLVASQAPTETNHPGDVMNSFSSEDIVSLDGVSPTDPIMVPDPAPAVDPVEEELKSPMKAAEPAPGSIGSAVSGPELQPEPMVTPDVVSTPEIAPTPDVAATPEMTPEPESTSDVVSTSTFISETPSQTATVNPEVGAGPTITEDFSATVSTNTTPSVSFNDPAEQQDNNQNIPDGAPKKKGSKGALITLIIVSIMVVIALATILVMQLMGSGVPTINIDSSVVDQTNDQTSGNKKGGNTVNTDINKGSNSSSNDGVIVCTAMQSVKDDLSLEFGQSVKSATATLDFMNDKFTGVSVEVVLANEDSLDAKSTVDFTAKEFFEQMGISEDDLEEDGISFDSDGNVEISKSEMMEVLDDGVDGYTCIGPGRS